MSLATALFTGAVDRPGSAPGQGLKSPMPADPKPDPVKKPPPSPLATPIVGGAGGPTERST